LFRIAPILKPVIYQGGDIFVLEASVEGTCVRE
jgi:hypothetical protein